MEPERSDSWMTSSLVGVRVPVSPSFLVSSTVLFAKQKFRPFYGGLPQNGFSSLGVPDGYLKIYAGVAAAKAGYGEEYLSCPHAHSRVMQL